MLLRTLGFVSVIVLLAVTVQAADKVKLRQGAPATGTITQMSPDEVVIEQGPISKKIPVNEILAIEYDDEPNELSLVRSAYDGGRYKEALDQLAKVDTGSVKRGEVRQDIDFYNAAASARLALAGEGSTSEAGRMLVAFENKNSGSYHYLEVCELLGDMLIAAGKPDAAVRYYEKLANSSLPDQKLKSGLLVARALEVQKQFDKAIEKYGEVISEAGDKKELEPQKLAATCGKAAAMAATGKVDEAVKMIEEVIAKADASDLELHARAYNALGSAYLAAGKKKEARIAYLHTDLLFAGFPDQHAEALAALSTLWEDADKRDRALEARTTLKERYPGSRWAQGK